MWKDHGKLINLKKILNFDAVSGINIFFTLCRPSLTWCVCACVCACVRVRARARVRVRV